MNLPEKLSDTYLFQTARSVQRGEINLEEAAKELIAGLDWGYPSDNEINRVDTLIQDVIRGQRELRFAYILAELNLAVCKAIGSPSQEIICSNTVGEAITALRDPRLTSRRIEVYEDALEIAEQSGDVHNAARLCNNLGNAYSELATGNRKVNLQTAVQYFKRALTTFTIKNTPYPWAIIQNNLAAAHKDIPGSDDESIRPAIQCWKQALKVFNREEFPFEWANVQRNLGIAYKDLNTGNPNENLAKARKYLLAAFKIVTQETRPIEWAEIQNTLGNLYFRITDGNRTENLRQAIACFGEALNIRTAKDFPVQYAATCLNLGNAWFALPDGSFENNLHRALRYYEEALTVYTPHDFPDLNAHTHTNQAAAYLFLPSGDRSQNLWRAEQSLAVALSVYNPISNPSQYAWAKTTLGAVYQAMAKMDLNYTHLAIDCFESALSFYTPDEFPVDYARTMDGLGTLYRDLIEGDPQRNYQQAEECYQAALSIYQPHIYPDEYAATQTNLGNCYLFWPGVDRSRTLPKAIECYRAALQIHSRESFPLDHSRAMDGMAIAYGLLADQKEEYWLTTNSCFQEALEAATATGARSEIVRIAGNAGGLGLKRGDWNSAYASLMVAINALEEMWGEHYSSEGRSEIQQTHHALYSRMIQACHSLVLKKETFDYVERSRSRSLLSIMGESLSPPEIESELAREKVAKISSLSESLRTMEAVIRHPISPEKRLNLIREEESILEERNLLLEELAEELPEYVALRRGQVYDYSSFKGILELN